jgi:hypothetical protein
MIYSSGAQHAQDMKEWQERRLETERLEREAGDGRERGREGDGEKERERGRGRGRGRRTDGRTDGRRDGSNPLTWYPAGPGRMTQLILKWGGVEKWRAFSGVFCVVGGADGAREEERDQALLVDRNGRKRSKGRS